MLPILVVSLFGIFANGALAQDLRVTRPVSPYALGVAVESLEMDEPGKVGISLGFDRAVGVLDALDPSTGRSIRIIDSQLHYDALFTLQHTNHLRFQVSLGLSETYGNPFDTFNGSGASMSDTVLGANWRLVDEPNIGLRLGLFGHLSVPTGRSTAFSGAGSTSVTAGALLSQRFDDLTFQGSLGYRHRTTTITFADTTFRDSVQFAAGLYIPLDWPNWLIFSEFSGVLNATPSETTSPEPMELFGGITFGKQTRTSIAMSSGLNAEGGSATHRLCVRIAHVFGDDSEDEVQSVNRQASPSPFVVAKIGPSSHEERRTPKNSGHTRSLEEARDNWVSALSPTDNAPLVRAPRQDSSPGTQVNTSSPTKRLVPSEEPTRASGDFETQRRNGDKSSASPGARAISQTKPSRSASLTGASSSVSVAATDTETPKISSNSTQDIGKTTATKTETMRTKPSANASAGTSAMQVKLTQPRADLRPMVVPSAPLTVSLNAGQAQSSTQQIQHLITGLREHLNANPRDTVVTIEAVAGPGERSYAAKFVTPQRDAYLLAKSRAEDAKQKLEHVFPKVTFALAPRIWPSHTVTGNDFWAGIVLAPNLDREEREKGFIQVSPLDGDGLAFEIDLTAATQTSDVDLLTDGMDVLIVRIKNLSVARKWVRLKHPKVKRALLHPSYENPDSGILRIRLNGTLPDDFRRNTQVKIKGESLQVYLPQF